MKLSNTITLTLGLSLLSATAHACDGHNHVRRRLESSEDDADLSAIIGNVADRVADRADGDGDRDADGDGGGDADYGIRDGRVTVADFTFESARDFMDNARCGQRTPSEEEVDRNREVVREWRERKGRDRRERRLSTKNIDVYFHRIYNDSNSGKVSDSAISQQIQILNNAFSPDFSFTLKATRDTKDTNLYNCQYGSSKTDNMKSNMREGGAGTLNIYSCNPKDGLLGWATFPDDYNKAKGKDGVIIKYGTMPGGNASPYNLGDTGTHEGK